MTNTNVIEKINIVSDQWNSSNCIKQMVEEGLVDDPFMIFDVGTMIQKFNLWKEKLPSIQPYYALKCNDKKIVAQILAALGCNFDCASKAEVQHILDIGVQPDRIIFANTNKLNSHILHAKQNQVYQMTFDSECELTKIKQHFPDARLFIRIKWEPSEPIQSEGKFGCEAMTQAPGLLKKALDMNLNVVGVAFHIRPENNDKATLHKAFEKAAYVLRKGRKMGHPVTILNIGGGFLGNDDAAFISIAREINVAFDKYFSSINEITVIAEPGRYFAASSFTLACQVFSTKEKCDTNGSISHTNYLINDSVYGSFNGYVYRLLLNLQIEPVKKTTSSEISESTIWGATCDNNDCVAKSVFLPKLQVGDWLMFSEMGAYTLPASSAFNGFPVPLIHVYVTEKTWKECPAVAEILKENYEVLAHN